MFSMMSAIKFVSPNALWRQLCLTVTDESYKRCIFPILPVNVPRGLPYIWKQTRIFVKKFIYSSKRRSMLCIFPTVYDEDERMIYKIWFMILIFSSPGLKAQVSFSESPLSVIINLGQSILGWREFNSVQMKGQALFQGEIITK